MAADEQGPLVSHHATPEFFRRFRQSPVRRVLAAMLSGAAIVAASSCSRSSVDVRSVGELQVGETDVRVQSLEQEGIVAFQAVVDKPARLTSIEATRRDGSALQYGDGDNASSYAYYGTAVHVSKDEVGLVAQTRARCEGDVALHVDVTDANGQSLSTSATVRFSGSCSSATLLS